MSDFFPPRPAATPTIYAFASTYPDHAGLLKVCYTERAAGDRIAVEQRLLNIWKTGIGRE